MTNRLPAPSANGTHKPAVEKAVGLAVRRMSKVKAEEVEWVWPGRVPLGMVTIFDGNTSLGKTTIAMWMAAHVSTGRAFPGSAAAPRPGVVLILSSEDSPEHVLRPRLEAAGADLDMVLFVDGLPTPMGVTLPVSLPLHLELLEAVIRANGAVLVVIDPLLGHIDADVDSHKDQSVRKVMHGLKGVAERTGAAIVCVRHLNKSNGGPAINRGTGSVAITAAARSVLCVGNDPGDQERHVLAVVKLNIAKKPPALAYAIESVTVGGIETSRVVFGDEVNLSADDIVTRPDQGQQRREDKAAKAEEFLRAELAGGRAVLSEDLIRLAKQQDIGRDSLFKAKGELGIVARKRKGEFAGRWEWLLPEPSGEASDSVGGQTVREKLPISRAFHEPSDKNDGSDTSHHGHEVSDGDSAADASQKQGVFPEPSEVSEPSAAADGDTLPLPVRRFKPKGGAAA